jgi:hypothetical protein
VFIGHAGHEEVEGTMGEAPDEMTLVESVADAEAIELPAERRLAYITQTTLSVDATRAIVDVLKRRFPRIEEPVKEDICYATSNRQWAVKELLDEVELLLVIGSTNSSNSKRLVEVAQTAGVAAYLIDDVGDIDPAWLESVETVGIVGRIGAERLVATSATGSVARRVGCDRASLGVRGRRLPASGRAAARALGRVASSRVRARPHRLDRLPEQYFTALLARVAAAAMQDGEPLADLGRGNPDIGPPPHVVDALEATARRPDMHGYAPFAGLPALKEAIAGRYRDVYGVTVDPEREVAVLPGAKTGLMEFAQVSAR